MYKPKIGAFAAAALIAAGGFSSQAAAVDLKSLYEGKQVTVVFGFGAGGTYGQYSLLLAHHFPRFIPGNPTMITQSMPGAGGLKASNHAANVMPKNGMFLFMPPDSIVVNQLLRGPKAARYNAGEFTWLGNVIESNSIIAVTKKSGVTSFEDAKKREVIMASTGKGSQTNIVPAMLNGVFGTKFKVVMGYKGARGSTHAMELGEAHGVSLTWLTLAKNRSKWWDDSPHPTKATAILQVGFKKEADLKGVPLARDIAPNAEGRQIIDFVATLGPIGRGLTTPPGMPKDLSMALRAAFEAMLKDKAFIADTEKRGLKVASKSGAEVQAIVADVLKMSPAVVKKARVAILGK
jgi:tripartite-type tricarboxylate transporter receptor subunit TctC